MKRVDKQDLFIYGRYILILLAGMSGLSLWYFLFTEPTILATSFILSFFGETIRTGSFLVFRSRLIEIIPSCVAGSAYYLLFILAMSLHKVAVKLRVKVLLTTFISLFTINVLRITIFSFLVDKDIFNTLHMFTWYFLSIVFVILIWFFTVRLYKVKSIPVYEDFKFLVKQTKKSKRTNKNKKAGKKHSKTN